jgi:hypothetical protein
MRIRGSLRVPGKIPEARAYGRSGYFVFGGGLKYWYFKPDALML